MWAVGVRSQSCGTKGNDQAMLLGSVGGAIPSPYDGQQPPVCAFYSGEPPSGPVEKPRAAWGRSSQPRPTYQEPAQALTRALQRLSPCDRVHFFIDRPLQTT